MTAPATVHRLADRGSAIGGGPVTTRLAKRDLQESVPMAEVQGTLALDLLGTNGMPAVTEYDTTVRSRLEAAGETELKAWAARFAQAVVESLGGDRPVTQLVRWTSRGVYRDLERRVLLLGVVRNAAVRARTVRPQVRSVHVSQPRLGSVEVSVHVRHGQRSRALAARLDHRDGRWLCTALELG